jgi:predicted metal-dependent peptidase
MDSKLETTLQELWNRSRFASYFYQFVQVIPVTGLPTLALTLSGMRLSLLYNPEFINKLDIEELIGLLIHEMLHVVLNHDHRGFSDEDPALQNLAQDMVINIYIADHTETFFSKKGRGLRDVSKLILPAGLPMIPEAFYMDNEPQKKGDTTWEALFIWMRSKRKRDIPDSSGMGNGTQFSYRMDSVEFPNHENDRNPESVKKGFQVFDSRLKNRPTGIHLIQKNDFLSSADAIKKRIISFAQHDETCREERFFLKVSGLISKIQKVDISDWKKKIAAFVDRSMHSDEFEYKTGRFNRRYFASGIYAPGRFYIKSKVVTVAVDVSGSMIMKPGEIEAAFGVVETLLKKYRIHLICIDENVFIPHKKEGHLFDSGNHTMPYHYRKGDWRSIKTGSSGTTFFSPLFDRFMKGHNEPLIVITDGFIYDLDQLKPYKPTLWAISENRKELFEPPFGKVVQIKSAQ